MDSISGTTLKTCHGISSFSIAAESSQYLLAERNSCFFSMGHTIWGQKKKETFKSIQL